MKILTKDDVKIEVIAEECDYEIVGNVLASGDDDLDKQAEDEIISRVKRGDIWVWASVEVRVTWEDLTESEYLGGCSYADEADFRENSGYFADMVAECLDRLNAKAQRIAEKITEVNHIC